jgi:hypothetical protein
MASKFVEKHKRKSVLAALLFIFQGRAKYVSIMLLVMILSVPFVISGETLNSIMDLPGVSAFLRSVGLGSVVSTINPKYSNDLLRAAMDKAAADSDQNSFWAKFLKSLNATLPPAGGPSSMAMIRGGGDIFGLPEIKEGKDGKRGPGQVKGVVNDEEKARGENGGDVDLEGLLAAGGAGGGGNEGGLYGDLMGQNLAGRFTGGSSAGANPYMNRTAMSGPGMTAGGQAAGMYSRVLGQAAGKVPVPGAPQKVNTKRMGRVSGFAWRNVGYKTSKAKMDVKLTSRQPMFQLAQTFAMTGSAFKSKDSALEYQAAYVGTTYDGNDSNLEAIQTDAASPVVPDTSFTGDLMTNVGDIQQQATNCSNAQGVQGANMSADGKAMDDISKTLGSPPKCCSGGVGAWNAKIDRIIYHCNDFNANEATLSAICQNKSSQMNCSGYNSMKIKPCSKWKCWLAIILMIFLGFLLGGLLGALIVGVLAGGSMLGGSMFGPVGDMVSGFISKIAGA